MKKLNLLLFQNILKKFVNKFNFKNIKVIYNPIILENKKSDIKFLNKKKFFFYLASNEKHKNLDCIIKAFKSRNINQDFKLVVVKLWS